MYGYYADVANECQLFHVCYPVLYPGGGEEMVKWSFICPNQTIFDQVRTEAPYKNQGSCNCNRRSHWFI